jgi:hypothetical protein
MSTSIMSDARWVRVGDLAPAELSDARLQCHHAVQIAVSAAISYLPSRSDDSHTALTWDARRRALSTELITAPRPFRIGMRPEDLALLAIGPDGRATSTFDLPGRTITDGHAWLGAIAAEAGIGTSPTSRKHYEIPDHAVARGAPFSTGSRVAFHELSRYWANAAVVLEDVSRTNPGASNVRTWPHHFDIATLITLADPSRTIGVGQSPGDDSYDEPYWYVGPRPYPQTADLPALAGGGHWHMDGWVGAALPASAFVAHPDQRGQVTAFIDSAVAACRSLLGA